MSTTPFSLSGYNFQEWPILKRIYDKNDILVQAMLAAGLEEIITNGFSVEVLPKPLVRNKRPSYSYNQKIPTVQPIAIAPRPSESLQKNNGVTVQVKKKQFSPQELGLKFKLVNEDLPDLKDEIASWFITD